MDRSGTIVFFVLLLLVFAFIILVAFLAMPSLIIGPGPVGSLPSSSNFVSPKIGESYYVTDVESGLYLGLEEVPQNNVQDKIRHNLNVFIESVPLRLSSKPVPWTIEESQDKKQNTINCRISGGSNGDVYSQFDDEEYVDTFLGMSESGKDFTLSGTAFLGFLLSPSSQTDENGIQLSAIVFQTNDSSLINSADLQGKTGRLRFSLVQ